MSRLLIYASFLIFATFPLSSCLSSCSERKPGEDNENLPVSDDVRDLANYNLVWSDEFDGKAVDSDTWNVEVSGSGGGNQELQYYRAENVTVGREPSTGRNCLILTAKKEQYKNREATSGRVNSKGKRQFLYGRLDASIRIPKTANGLWPAFWTMGELHDWPKCGEIDVMEMGNSWGIGQGTQERYFNGACHWGENPSASHPSHAQHHTSDYGLQDGFTLWTLVWEEDRIRMYLDLDKYPHAEPYFEMAIAKSETANAAGRYFHQPNHILLNLAVGGNFPQIYDINGVTALASGPASMYVDYVRLYKFKGK